MDKAILAEIRKKVNFLQCDIGRKLKAIRLQKKQTLNGVSKGLKISATTLSNIENGKVKRLTIGRVMYICEYYKVDYYSVVNTSIMN